MRRSYTTALRAGSALALIITAGLAHRAYAGHTASSDGTTTDWPALNVVTITARDYAFEAPDTIAAGATTIQLVNRGPDFHHVWLVRLDDGKTMSDYVNALKQGGPLPTWAVDVGGPNAPAPNSQTNATVELTPGRYVLTCVIPAKDGMPHIMKGMIRELTVTPSSTPSALPAADVTMSLADYDFRLSKPLTAGRHVIRVRNDAAQPHEVVLVRLAPGKTVQDALHWLEKPNGPPPISLIGGTTGLAHGLENNITVDLEQGEYGLICFAPDAKDGKPHFVHGMVKQITVD